ncbi:MAG: Abortive infection protein AbiEi [Elusimicrobia bacterium]|nr:Abortive infection protein AbiEi [Elusimicrobiota bacterium]
MKDLSKFNKTYMSTNSMLRAGFHTRDIKSLLSEGKIIQLRRGIYRLSDVKLVSNQGFIDISQAVPKGIICLLSALEYHGLTTANPTVVSVAIPRSVRMPKILFPPASLYYFSPKQYREGIEKISINGYQVKIYGAEKTICDCFRYKNKLGLDVAKEGLKEYLKRKNRDLPLLLRYAKICRVAPLIKTWLNALV